MSGEVLCDRCWQRQPDIAARPPSTWGDRVPTLLLIFSLPAFCFPALSAAGLAACAAAMLFGARAWERRRDWRLWAALGVYAAALTLRTVARWWNPYL